MYPQIWGRITFFQKMDSFLFSVLMTTAKLYLPTPTLSTSKFEKSDLIVARLQTYAYLAWKRTNQTLKTTSSAACQAYDMEVMFVKIQLKNCISLVNSWFISTIYLCYLEILNSIPIIYSVHTALLICFCCCCLSLNLWCASCRDFTANPKCKCLPKHYFPPLTTRENLPIA